MKKFLFSVVALAGLFMASCSNDPAQEPAPVVKGGKVISLAATMSDYTRATDTTFEEGDQIGLYIFTTETYLNNVAYTYANSAFAAATQQVWYEDEAVESQVVAYYPYAATAAAESHTFTVAAAQTTHAAYTASDLMVASTTATPTEEAVALPFKHMLSKVNLTIDNQTEEAVKSVHFVDVAGTVSYQVKSAAETLAASGSMTIEAGKLDDGTYTLIMAPQTVAPKMVITTESGESYSFEVASAVEFKAGTVSSATVTIEKEEDPIIPEPEPDPVTITISWTITDWAEGEDLNFVQSEEDIEVDTYKFYIDVTATGWENVNIWAWDADGNNYSGGEWPGAALTETVEMDGITYWIFDVPANVTGKTISVIFNNGSEKTVDLTGVVMDQDHTFTLTEKDGAGKWLATIDGAAAPQPAALKLYAHSEEGWSNMNLWAWDDANNYSGGTWPGVELTEKETVNGVEYFVYSFGEEMRGKTISIIFNNGSAQTQDITGVVLDGPHYYGVKAGNAFEVDPSTYTGGDGSADEEAWFFFGSDTGWSSAAMTYDAAQDGWKHTINATAESHFVIHNNGQAKWIGAESSLANGTVGTDSVYFFETGVAFNATDNKVNIAFRTAGEYDVWYFPALNKACIVNAGATPAK